MDASGISKKDFHLAGSNALSFDIEEADANNLFEAEYQMASFVVPVMVRKDVNKETYDLLQDLRHDNLIPLLDFFFFNGKDKTRHDCVVIPEVGEALDVWLKNGGQLLIFDMMDHMTEYLNNMIIEFSDLIGSLNKEKLVIKNLDIYIKVVTNSPPSLCILLTEVTRVNVLGTVDTTSNWDHVRDFVAHCETWCDVKRDKLTSSFCNFIGGNYLYSLDKLKRYPHNWNYEKKGCYLMALVAGKHGDIEKCLGRTIDWPCSDGARVSTGLPELIQWIIEFENENGRGYSLTRPFDYIILLRNCFKHYRKFPKIIKDILKDREAIINQVEKWDPNFWTKIYERVGWP